MTNRKRPRIGSNNEQVVPNCSRNVGTQADGGHHGVDNGEDEVNPMAKENDDIGVIHNAGINRLIKNTFHSFPIDDNFDGYVEDAPLIEKGKNVYMEAHKQIFSTKFYCW